MENLIPGTKRLNLAQAPALTMHQYGRKRSMYSLALRMPYACVYVCLMSADILSAYYNSESCLIASMLSFYGTLGKSFGELHGQVL